MTDVTEPRSPSTTDLPSVSVVIPAFTIDRWELLKKGVAAARRQTVPVASVIVCIDNNHDLYQRAVAEWADSPGVPVLVLANEHDAHLDHVSLHQRAHGTTRRFGAGSARNTAAAAVTADVIAFIDDDAFPEPDWLANLLPPYRDPTVTAVGGAPLPDFESRRPTWFPLNFDWVFGCAYDGLPTEPGPIRRMIGANMSVRTEALHRLGGFQGSDFDDLNLCLRLSATYGPESIRYIPSAIVHHYVPKNRVSWRYFWRRCYFVNREKVKVFRRIGAPSSLAAEREFAVRSLRRRTAGDLRRGFSGEPGAFLAIGAMFVGLALAALGNLRGRFDGARESL